VLHNGFGCAVMEHLADQQITTPIARIGWPDEFIEHGTVPILRQKHGLTVEATVQKILSRLETTRVIPAIAPVISPAA
jgi:1-deoxy-D-xylulose-5-phosphate synthase